LNREKQLARRGCGAGLADSAWVSGSYTETITAANRPTVTLLGQFLLVLHRGRQAGWLIARMMWTDAH